MKHQNWSWLCSLYSGDLNPLCVRVMMPSLNVWLCAGSTSPVSLGAGSTECLAAEGSGGCFVSSSPFDVWLSYPSLTPTSCCTLFLWGAAAAPSPPMFAPTAVWPGGEPKWRPHLSGIFLPWFPRPKKVCRGFFYKWVRPGGQVGQGMKCLGWELRDRETCWWSLASGSSWTNWMLLAVSGLAALSLPWLVSAAMSLLP